MWHIILLEVSLLFELLFSSRSLRISLNTFKVLSDDLVSISRSPRIQRFPSESAASYPMNFVPNLDVWSVINLVLVCSANTSDKCFWARHSLCWFISRMLDFEGSLLGTVLTSFKTALTTWETFETLTLYCKSQHSHSHFNLGVHVPLGFSIWGYRSLFEGTHIFGVIKCIVKHWEDFIL